MCINAMTMPCIFTSISYHSQPDVCFYEITHFMAFILFAFCNAISMRVIVLHGRWGHSNTHHPIAPISGWIRGIIGKWVKCICIRYILHKMYILYILLLSIVMPNSYVWSVAICTCRRRRSTWCPYDSTVHVSIFIWVKLTLCMFWIIK